MKKILDVAVLIAVATSAACTAQTARTEAPAPALASGKQVINMGAANPNAVLSPAIRVGDVVYASGQLGLSRQAPDSTIEGQTRLSLDNTKRVLEAAGTTIENVVKCTVFLTRASDFQGMNRVYREFFPKDPPARSTVVVAALVVPAAVVEIECMAVMPK
jgi:2-iminobutanoate/2-iminopropanoate deaminase